AVGIVHHVTNQAPSRAGARWTRCRGGGSGNPLCMRLSVIWCGQWSRQGPSWRAGDSSHPTLPAGKIPIAGRKNAFYTQKRASFVEFDPPVGIVPCVTTKAPPRGNAGWIRVGSEEPGNAVYKGFPGMRHAWAPEPLSS